MVTPIGDGMLAVVSDGCSTGERTDIGSRIIALTTAKAVKGHCEIGTQFTPQQIALLRRDGIRQASFNLGLSFRDLLATCVYAYISPEGGLIHVEGDGVFALKYTNGDITLYRYDWAENKPFYPVYHDGKQAFIAEFGGDLNLPRLTKKGGRYSNGVFTPFADEEITLGTGVQGVTELIPGLDGDLEFVAIFTDGVTQVENIPWHEAVYQLLGFKTSEGEFAIRRMNRMVSDSRKVGKGPVDDISFAVIKINQTEHGQS